MKTYLLALFLFFSLGLVNSSAQSIAKTWQFSGIHDGNGNHLFPVTKSDSIVFNNGEFSYSLAAKNNLKASGDYIHQNNLLVFYYNTPKDTIRRYKITQLTDSTLTLSENNVFYKFRFEKPVIPSKLKTSNFSFIKLFRGIIGICFLIGSCYLLSANKKAIDWRLVITGLSLQIIFALLVLKIGFVAAGFEWLSNKIVEFLALSDKGAEFLFGGLITKTDTFGYIFAFKVLPTVVFFSAFTSLLYYLGILQKIVYGFAWVMSKTMKLSGAESLAAAANIFIGQTEAPLVVKPYLEKMTKSELLSLMVGGMATIAGGVLAAFITFLGGESDAEKVIFAKHLLTASVMSAPAALLIAKMLYPQTEPEKIDTNLTISKNKLGTNILDAISRGTTDGLKLAVNVGAMLLVFTALMAVLNWITGDLIGKYTGLNSIVASVTDGRYSSLSMQYILGIVFAPIAWLIGVPFEDITLIGQLLGEKTILNEFFAYASLSSMKAQQLISNQRSIIIATYALCGFANFASIGIQIGGISVLAPSQRENLAKFGIKALIGGTAAALLTATIAGVIVG